VQTGLSTFVTLGISQFDSEYKNLKTHNFKQIIQPLYQTGSYRTFGGGSAPIFESNTYSIDAHSADQEKPEALKQAIDNGSIKKPE